MDFLGYNPISVLYWNGYDKIQMQKTDLTNNLHVQSKQSGPLQLLYQMHLQFIQGGQKNWQTLFCTP